MRVLLRKVSGSTILLVFLVPAVVLWGGCGGGGEHTIYHYSGGGTPGDFYTYDVDMTAQTFSWTDVTTAATGSGTFTATSTPKLYQAGTGEYFAMLPDNVIVAVVKSGNTGELFVGLKTTVNPYGTGIDGDYNFMGLDKNYGTVNVAASSADNSKGKVVGTVHLLGQTADIHFDADYSFYNLYNAIKLTESAASAAPGYYYYAVFVNNDITVLDAYSSDGQGRGILVGVRKLVNPDVSTYSGTYSYIDSNAGHGTYTINVSGGAISDIAFAGQDASGTPINGSIPGTTITDNHDGNMDFTFTAYPSRILLLPNKIIAVCIGDASKSGTYVIGIKQ